MQPLIFKISSLCCLAHFSTMRGGWGISPSEEVVYILIPQHLFELWIFFHVLLQISAQSLKELERKKYFRHFFVVRQDWGKMLSRQKMGWGGCLQSLTHLMHSCLWVVTAWVRNSGLPRGHWLPSILLRELSRPALVFQLLNTSTTSTENNQTCSSPTFEPKPAKPGVPQLSVSLLGIDEISFTITNLPRFDSKSRPF